MRAALALVASLAAACAGSGAGRGAEATDPTGEDTGAAREGAVPAGDAQPAGEAPPARGGSSVVEVQCLETPLPARLRVRFEPGHTARDVAVWYATTACRPVRGSRQLLGRATLTEIDALVGRDELSELLDSLLRGLGLVSVDRGDGVEIVSAGAAPPRAGGDALLLAPVTAEDEREQEESSP